MLVTIPTHALILGISVYFYLHLPESLVSSRWPHSSPNEIGLFPNIHIIQRLNRFVVGVRLRFKFARELMVKFTLVFNKVKFIYIIRQNYQSN